jgi:hypothetical protein
MSHYSNQAEAYEEKVSQIEEQMKAALNEPLDLDTTLDQRGDRYGSFVSHSALSQTLKNTIMQHYFLTHGQDKATPLPPYMVEAISMICHKLARIANGDPHYDDSWHDISGYAELVVKELNKS